MQITEELRNKLLNAKNVTEVAVICHENGVELTAEKAERIFDEIKNYNMADGEELSLDELDAVSGGADRDWLKEGCYATVEGTSWCGRNDLCAWLWTTYDHKPVKFKCPGCDVWLHQIYEDSFVIQCHVCKRTFTSFDFEVIM